MEEWRQSMFTLSVAQLMIQIYVQMKQDLINVNNIFFSFLLLLSLPNIHFD